jgi:hypothetical protein
MYSRESSTNSILRLESDLLINILQADLNGLYILVSINKMGALINFTLLYRKPATLA